MSDRLKIFCTNLNRYIDFEGGDTLKDIYTRIAPELGFEAICARVNNKTEGLAYSLFRPKMVEFLPYDSDSGRFRSCWHFRALPCSIREMATNHSPP